MIQTRSVETAFGPGFELRSILQVVNLGQVFSSHLHTVFLSSIQVNLTTNATSLISSLSEALIVAHVPCSLVPGQRAKLAWK